MNTVIINESACIGCTKCIQVCPVDAIFGAAQMMHTIIQEECIGCNLCIPACPVDCIIIQIHPEELSKEDRLVRAEKTRHRVNIRKLRLQQDNSPALGSISVSDKKAQIAAAIERARMKAV